MQLDSLVRRQPKAKLGAAIALPDGAGWRAFGCVIAPNTIPAVPDMTRQNICEKASEDRIHNIWTLNRSSGNGVLTPSLAIGKESVELKDVKLKVLSNFAAFPSRMGWGGWAPKR